MIDWNLHLPLQAVYKLHIDSILVAPAALPHCLSAKGFSHYREIPPEEIRLSALCELLESELQGCYAFLCPITN